MLEEALRTATDVARASEAVADHLVASGFPTPSVYLARGGRLRVQAHRGYRQILDGMPPSAGVIGRTYRTGVTAIIADVADAPEYLTANPTMRAEVCVPVRSWGSVVGIVNVESTTPFTPEQVAEVEAAAAALGATLERLGHVLNESPAQRLVRHAIHLGTLTAPAEIHAELVDAACDVAGLDSAALLLQNDGGRFSAVEATGPLADVLGLAAEETVEAIAALVAQDCSCFTVDGNGEDSEGIRELRAGGAATLVALPLSAGPDRRAILLLADRRPLASPTEVVELLELLTAHAGSCLRTAAALDELETRAATDALTGLGHHATFHAAFARARDRREAVAVLIADVDGFKAINDARGHQAGDRVLRETAAALSGALRRGDELFRIGGDEFAAIVRVGEPHDALEAGRRLREAVAGSEVTVSIGVAVPMLGESDQSVLARADRALYEVKDGGRDGVALAGAA
jgi:diguanylate cyclase (GGDEF)-like protein